MSKLTKEQLQNVKSQFKDHDVNGDGSITLAEFKAILGDYYDDAYLAKLLKESDKNGDGKVSYKEFLASHGG